MDEVADSVSAWFAAGRRVVLATIVAVEGTAPRDAGAMFAISDGGEFAGAISGGCVESALLETAQAIFGGAAAQQSTFGPEDLMDAGLTCGGTIIVISAEVSAELFHAYAQSQRSALAIRLAAPYAHALIDDDAIVGALGTAAFTSGVVDEARAMLRSAQTAIRAFGPDGEPIGEERVFISTFVERPLFYIVGAVDFARPLTQVARILGFRCILIDPRAAFATAERFPDADAIHVGWPQDVLQAATLDARSVVVTLAHDPKFDLPTLEIALRSAAGFVGAMGSRGTNERRLLALRERGLDDAALARLHAPIGLDLGARTPEETAISILAEIIAVRHDRGGGPLTGGRGPLRGSNRALDARAVSGQA